MPFGTVDLPLIYCRFYPGRQESNLRPTIYEITIFERPAAY
jgi:hypothetical protein